MQLSVSFMNKRAGFLKHFASLIIRFSVIYMQKRDERHELSYWLVSTGTKWEEKLLNINSRNSNRLPLSKVPGSG